MKICLAETDFTFLMNDHIHLNLCEHMYSIHTRHVVSEDCQDLFHDNTCVEPPHVGCILLIDVHT